MSTIEQTTGGAPVWTTTDRLRKARESFGLNQKELARRSGISLRTISNYENPGYEGERKRPFMVSWAMACGVSPQWLIDGVASGPDHGPDVGIPALSWMGEPAGRVIGAGRFAAAA